MRPASAQLSPQTWSAMIWHLCCICPCTPTILTLQASSYPPTVSTGLAIASIMGTDQEYNSGADATEWRPMDPDWIYDTISTEYAEVYPNLAKHDSRYPSPEELIERTKIGNIEFEGDYFNIVLEVTDNGSPALTRYAQASDLSDCFYWPFLSSDFRNAIIVKQPDISRL